MRLLYLLSVSILALFLNALTASATIDAALQMQLGNPSGADFNTNNHDHFLILRTVEAIDYSDNLAEPNWASWDLTASDLGTADRTANFITDTNLPADFYEVIDTDYSGVGFDRGHMCPSADRTDNPTDNALVFFFSNIIPQAANNNEGIWANFEDYCRSLVRSGDELMIICGPGGFNGSYVQPSQRIMTPGFTWKVVVVIPPGAGTALSRITTSTRCIVIKVPNNNSVASTWQTYVTSAKQIEVDTGFTFFSALPSNVADALRNEVDGQSGTPPAITGISPSSGAVNSSVILTGTTLSSASEVTFNGTPASFVQNSATQITATVPTNANAGAI
ncbi:MAG TPA: DNA/RNA non-specific endonuclease, partial [Verrucomicrobiae bacterium]|nr:DNA/RNA non-specific endonuclease [Verrucomicrobiae bacterium]